MTGAALASLAAEGFSGGVRRVEEVHRAIAERAFGGAGSSAATTRAAHDAISAGAYAAVRGLGAVTGWAAGAAAAARGVEIRDGGRAGLARGALNGVVGDRLERDGSPFAVPMAVRPHGADVTLTRAGLAGAFPAATGRVAVLLHGLCETDEAWRLGAARRGRTYATSLRELGWTPVHLRYNTGAHISTNGLRLADLLDELVAQWPVELRELTLVGHSMGGLVIRSACHAGHERGDAWVPRVKTTVALGTPHAGAPLERAANAASWLLRKLPESSPIAAVLDVRSAGIKDLRYGSLLDADWDGRDPDALWEDACGEVPLLEGVRHCGVAATITRDANAPLGRLLGDLLVLDTSARGRGRRTLPFVEDDVRGVGGATHISLLNHPDVDALLRDWLA